MRFILGFFVGLLTGILITLAPIVSVFFALAVHGANNDDEPSTPTSET